MASYSLAMAALLMFQRPPRSAENEAKLGRAEFRPNRAGPNGTNACAQIKSQINRYCILGQYSHIVLKANEIDVEGV